ncbi:MAG: hypothetical protein IPM22_14840 [Betaproteobacteria bacterium]|nr:hypothetical protein [Betaproteobacteria bacterium]
MLLARYRYDALKSEPTGNPLQQVSLVTIAERGRAATAGAERGRTLAAAGALARDLANAPPKHLTAEGIASVAGRVGKQAGLAVEVFDKDAIARARTGRPARRQRRQRRAAARGPHDVPAEGQEQRPPDPGSVRDSRTIPAASTSPRDPMHAVMKMDMSGARARCWQRCRRSLALGSRPPSPAA